MGPPQPPDHRRDRRPAVGRLVRRYPARPEGRGRHRPGAAIAVGPDALSAGVHRPPHRGQAPHRAGSAAAPCRPGPAAGRHRRRIAAAPRRRAPDRQPDPDPVEDRRGACPQAAGGRRDQERPVLFPRDAVRRGAHPVPQPGTGHRFRLRRRGRGGRDPGAALRPLRLMDRRRPRRQSLRHPRRHPAGRAAASAGGAEAVPPPRRGVAAAAHPLRLAGPALGRIRTQPGRRFRHHGRGLPRRPAPLRQRTLSPQAVPDALPARPAATAVPRTSWPTLPSSAAR